MPQDTDPATVVQRQLDAYNARDIEALLKIYSDDAQMFEHPDKPLCAGSAQLRERFVARFAEPNLYAHLLSRMAMGDTVIDHERVTRTFPEGPGELELVMIYQVKDGRISKAWNMAGPKTLFSEKSAA